MGNSLVQALRYSGALNWENTNTKIKCEETGERRGGGACNHFFKQPIPVYQLLVYPLIGQICQIISTLSKQVVPVAQKDGMQHPRMWNSGIHYNVCVEQMFTRFPTHRSAEEGTEDFPCELGVWKKCFCHSAAWLWSCMITKWQQQNSHRKELSTHSSPDSHYLRISLEELACKNSVPSGNDWGEMAVFTGYDSFTAKIWLSQMRQKWAEEGRKRNDYRLSLISIFLFPSSPTFSRAFYFHVFPTICEPGTG